ncbi:MAG: diadenosine tetraphosphatase ApaH/serine/threonine PP2A family protein phosphatase [Myxococcota bacterium]|jgi:diadenosine tetraphosphatase ApaH/serine/threonine PP2A family protein phosphatase
MTVRTLFVGDVHGCSAELAALLAKTRPTRVILVGDLFTKGPDPDGVWRLIVQHGAEAVMGNHDDFVLTRWRLRGRRLAPADAIAWLADLPLSLSEPGWLCVHAGIHPTGGLAQTPRDQMLNLRRWPDDSDPKHPFWWEGYTGAPLVIYGHDARRGLVDRRPHTLGLDTGCVYGGRLTGYLLEENALVSVPAEAIYCPVSKPATIQPSA